LKEALQGSDTHDAVKQALTDLNDQAAAMGQAICAAAQARQEAEQAQAGADAPAAGDDDVVEAEIIDEDK
ncbi:MAG: molecular chaperone DnaK, partial [Propionibacteriaceae bacterium]|nr:molecular chaperone DnaK [Propionibacteriaceae bacterium]